MPGIRVCKLYPVKVSHDKTQRNRGDTCLVATSCMNAIAATPDERKITLSHPRGHGQGVGTDIEMDVDVPCLTPDRTPLEMATFDLDAG